MKTFSHLEKLGKKKNLANGNADSTAVPVLIVDCRYGHKYSDSSFFADDTKLKIKNTESTVSELEN